MISIFNYIISNITKWKGTTSRAKYWQIFLVAFVIGFTLEVISKANDWYIIDPTKFLF